MLPWELAGHQQYVIMVPQFELPAKTTTAPPAPLESDDSDDSASIMQDDLDAPAAPRPSAPPQLPGFQECLGIVDDKDGWTSG
jgi:hypothetical protein